MGQCCVKRPLPRATQGGLGSHRRSGSRRFRVQKVPPGRALEVSEYRKMSRTNELKDGENQGCEVFLAPFTWEWLGDKQEMVGFTPISVFCNDAAR